MLCFSGFELYSRWVPPIFDRKPTIRNKRESKLLKQNNEEKRNIVIRDTIPALSVYYKASLNEKMESYTKPTITSINFKRTTNHFLTKKENR